MMACYHPLYAYRDPETHQIRILDARFDRADANLTLPCGQCQGCRLERSRQWAVRVMHEASLYKQNSFVTLTYNDEHLKPSLDYSDYQKFMKRLRKAFSGQEVRFYMCGEYGEQNRRPHFHACLFNVDFQDKTVWRKDRGNYIYRSELLERLWPFGFSSIGELTFQSAAYVARYVMKKQTGFRSEEAYKYTDPETGEVLDLTPEFNKMSLKPGIGARWFEKYQSDVYPNDYLVVNGVKTRPPRYYDKLFHEQKNLLASSDLEVGRYERAQKYVDNNTDERLAVREQVLSAKIKKLKRSL
jgi:hypothetical protein